MQHTNAGSFHMWHDSSIWNMDRYGRTGWRRPIGCLKLQVTFRKRATNYVALLRKMTNKDKASCGSTPPCSIPTTMYRYGNIFILSYLYVCMYTHIFVYICVYIYILYIYTFLYIGSISGAACQWQWEHRQQATNFHAYIYVCSYIHTFLYSHIYIYRRWKRRSMPTTM